MDKQKIEVYIDNLDVNTQADLLKRILIPLIRKLDNLSKEELDNFTNDILFIEKQIEEFNENYTDTKQELKQFEGG